MTGERWLPVPGHEGRYEVSDHGRVRNMRTGRVLRPALVTGYERVTLYSGRPSPWLVHRLVLLAFDRPPRDGEQVRHLDGDRRNNHLGNLAWGTAAQNGLDRQLHGTAAQKLKPHHVRLVRRMVRDGATLRQAGAAVGVSKQMAHQIVRGECWSHVTGGAP